MTIVEVDRKPILGSTVRAGTRQASIAIDAALISTHQKPDSMAVVGLITALEDRFGIALDDDDISGETFSTVGALTALVEEKLAL